MKTTRALSLLLDLILLAASMVTSGPVNHAVVVVAVLVASILGGLSVFVAVCLTVAVVQSRQPPYPMTGDHHG
jgi:hypothetical protein